MANECRRVREWRELDFPATPGREFAFTADNLRRFPLQAKGTARVQEQRCKIPTAG
jgi:hypothetical protein